MSKRREDILPILDYYLADISGKSGEFKFSKSALTKLQTYDWPGNISQLINYIEKSLILNQDNSITNELDPKVASLPNDHNVVPSS